MQKNPSDCIHCGEAIKLRIRQFKKPCFTDCFKCQYIMNTTANVKIVTKFLRNQILTQVIKGAWSRHDFNQKILFRF